MQSILWAARSSGGTMNGFSWSRGLPMRASVGLAALAMAGGALAADVVVPPPHWSGLPIWGQEAAAKGYILPLPFGVGITAYAAEQPVDIHDLQLARRGNEPHSVTNFLQIDRVDTKQQNVSLKLDVLVLPFFNVYGLLGYTTGSTKGNIQIPDDPILGIIQPQVLKLDASFQGPTYGLGMTFQGGGKVHEWRDLTAFAVVDVNRTQTKLSFDNEALIAHTKPIATVFSARFGMGGIAGPNSRVGFWIGAMHQKIQQRVAGGVADTDLEFAVTQSPAKPWNTLIGGVGEIGRNVVIVVEGGVGERKSLLASAVYRF